MSNNTELLVQTESAYFLDFEASSLDEDSWPVEIGIAWIEDGSVLCESKLIRPEPDWNKGAWSEASADIHGLRLDVLASDGSKAQDVATWFKARNRGIAITDNPEFERRWLIRLLATDLPFPAVQILDFDSYVRMTLPNAAAVARAYEILKKEPTPHRAGPDAARLARAWLIGATT
jgi:DNA polymerase III epsilon subunit-like protein